MSIYNAIEKLNEITTLCKIALTHASTDAKNEVVGHFSGRTLEVILNGIKDLSKDARDLLIAEKTGMEA